MATESNVGVGGWSLQPSSPFWRASRLLECLSVLEEVKWANLPVDTGCEIPFFFCVLPLSGNTGWQEEEGFLVVLLTSYLRCCSPFWQTGWKSSGRKSLLWKKSRKSLKIIATVTVNIRRIKAVICFLLWFLRDFSFWRDCLLISRIVGTLSESLRSWIIRWSLVLFSSILVVGIECEILAWKVVLWLHFMFLPPTESVFKQSVFWLYSK